MSVTVSQRPSEIHGAKWHDRDADGTRDNDEPGLGGWRIYIDQNANGEWDEGEPSALTDSNGQYAIAGLAAGTYTVAEQLQAGHPLRRAGRA